jgi:hypothetical protein
MKMPDAEFRKCDLEGCRRRMRKTRTGRGGILLSKQQMLEGFGAPRGTLFLPECGDHSRDQSGIFLQRVPVPVSVWKPFWRGGAPMHLGGPAVLELGGERAALLICYEQVISWTVLTAALAHPSLFVGMSNDHWATRTPIPQWQALCLRAWSRLFWVPYLLAVNT